MPSTRYELGRNVEYAAVDKLTRCGWFAMRAPSSKGPADVLAIRPLGPYTVAAMVNCKRDIATCGPEDWNKTWSKARAFNAIPLMAGRFKGRRGVRFMRMTGPKRLDGPNNPQPWEPFEPKKEDA